MSYKIVSGRRSIEAQADVYNVNAVYEVKPPFTPGDEFFNEIIPGSMALYAVTRFSTIISFYGARDYETAESASNAEIEARAILKEQLSWIGNSVELDAIGSLGPNAESVS